MGNVEFVCPAGHMARGYLAAAGDGNRAVVVLQEWWGLNGQICDVADRFAAAGYTALAPDLYQGRVTGDADEAGHLMEGLDWAGATAQEARGALKYLKARGAASAAVMGFCMGGALTVVAGVLLHECDVAVCFYGIPPTELADPRAMRIPFQGHFAERDDWCTPAAVDEFEGLLAESGAPCEVHRYPAAHAFFNQEQSVYDEQAAELAWRRTLGFFDQHL
ncbi:MAG: dienelactone hydrolase family protein [Gammaproteobacteria bacterium]|nr:dienelactone hydrolase family protein [Gammaproteobacteria bacterium]